MEVECSALFECHLNFDGRDGWWYVPAWHRLDYGRPDIWAEEWGVDVGVMAVEDGGRERFEFRGGGGGYVYDLDTDQTVYYVCMLRIASSHTLRLVRKHVPLLESRANWSALGADLLRVWMEMAVRIGDV